MTTTTYSLSASQERTLRNSLLAKASDGAYNDLQDVIDYGVTDLGYPEPVVERIMLDLRRQGLLWTLEVGD